MPPPRETALYASPISVAGGKVIASPFQFYMTGEDNLRLRIWSSVACEFAFQGRWLQVDHTILPFRHPFTTTTDRLPVTHNISVAPGFLLNCSLAIINTTIVRPGECYAQLALVRGRDAGATEMGVILQGYVSTGHWQAFPGSPITHNFEGPGRVRTVTNAAPAAGANFGIQVPEHARWRLQSLFAPLTTSGAGGNRTVLLEFNNGGGVVQARSGGAFAHPPAATFSYSCAPGVVIAGFASGFGLQIPVPYPYFHAGLSLIASFTEGLLAGDQWGDQNLTVEEWLDIDTAFAFL